jgi:hypothetical protein
MSTRGILGSPYQRRVIVTFSLVAIAILLLFVILVNALTPETRAWKLVSDILVALTASAMFALLSAGLLRRFRLFGQLPGRNKLKGPGSRLLVSFFPEIKFILSSCGVL